MKARLMIFAFALLALFASCSDGEETLQGKQNATVVYFSATGNTEHIADYIADILSIDAIEIRPEAPYTSADLNWNNPESRVNEEHDNYPASRPAIEETEDISGYDTIYLGYPIWWGNAPSVVLTFLESVDLEGKTIVPFCTSSSSGIGNSVEHLIENSNSSGTWLSGRRFSSSASRNDVQTWLESIESELMEGV